MHEYPQLPLFTRDNPSPVLPLIEMPSSGRMTQASLLRALVAPRRAPARRRRRVGHGLPIKMPLAMIGTGGRLMLMSSSRPHHRRAPARRRTTHHRGAGFFGDVWDGIKSVASKFGPRLIDAGLKRFGVGMRRRPAVRRRRPAGGSMMPRGSGTMRRSHVVRRRRHVGGLLYPGSHYGGSSMIPLRMP